MGILAELGQGTRRGESEGSPGEGAETSWRADSSQAGAPGATTSSPGQVEAIVKGMGVGVTNTGSPSPFGKVAFTEGSSLAESKPLNISEETTKPSPTIVPKRKLRTNMGIEQVATGWGEGTRLAQSPAALGELGAT